MFLCPASRKADPSKEIESEAAPLALLLGLPIIAANDLSNYPAMYSGTFHYSAPVAPYLVLAAIGGTVYGCIVLFLFGRSWLAAFRGRSP